MSRKPKMRKYRVIVSADGLPTESYDLPADAKESAVEEAKVLYMRAHDVPPLGGPLLRTTVEEI